MTRTSTHTDVIVVGSGPTGMMLAAELRLGGVDAVVLERRPDHGLAGSRAGGFHSRTIEILDQRGIADRFLAAGYTAQATMIGSTVLDMSDFPSRHPYALALFQNEIESILGEWLVELGIAVTHGGDVSAVEQDDDGVAVDLADGRRLRARHLVGCDGGRSFVRRAAGIGFPGSEATRSNLIAEVAMSEDPPEGMRHDAVGIHGCQRLDSGLVRVIVSERELGAGEPTLAELSDALVAVFGSDFGVHDPVWLSRFTDAARQAERYRAGRILVAGDAAHVHYPAGGQGVTLGIGDAVNLGWKLAAVVRGTSPESLLDTYHAERHPVAARALEHTRAQAAVQRRDGRQDALVDLVTELAGMDEPRKALCGLLSGLDVHYDLGAGHPLLGRRVPDVDLVVDGVDGVDGDEDGGVATRVHALLHDARPVVLDLGDGGLAVDGWDDQVRLVHARSVQGTDGWELPVIGRVDAPTGLLVRPDGHVAWVGEGSARGLAAALERWCGPARVR